MIEHGGVRRSDAGVNVRPSTACAAKLGRSGSVAGRDSFCTGAAAADAAAEFYGQANFGQGNDHLVFLSSTTVVSVWPRRQFLIDFDT